MEGITEKRAATEIINYQDEKSEKLPPKLKVSRRTSFLCFSFFFLLGICNFLPISFFAAANNFWLSKFANTTNPDAPRTRLQVNFASSITIIGTLSSLIFGTFNITLAHRFKIVSRMISCLTLELIIFMLFAISTVVNTENVQLMYFIGVLFAYGVLSGGNTVNLLASAKLYLRFPPEYMKTCLLGQSTGGVIGDILNIMSVVIFKDLIKSTLLYFVIACVAISVTMILFACLSRSEFFKKCLESIPENVDKKMHSIQELGHLLYKIKYPTIILLYYMLTAVTTHSSVTSLVVSEQHEDKTIWAENYFSPVMTFLLADTFFLLGRLYVTFYSFYIPEKVFYVVGPIRMALLVPFIWMSNAQPREHLPVLFSHDYQYGIIMAVLTFTNGVIVSWGVLLIPKLVEKHETDTAYTAFTFAINICDIFIAPLGIFIVNVL